MDQFRYPKDMIELAVYIGKYRKALIDQKVPEGLADQLVRDWHTQALTGEEQRSLRLADVEHVGKVEH